MVERVYVALGANIGEPRAALSEAQARLRGPAIRSLRRARLYRTAPVGPADQPIFWNTVVEIETSLEPEALLRDLKAIEATMGRTPTVRWGPRVIDLDIVVFGARQVDTPNLVIPHVQMARRRFVLAPLADLVPDLHVPGTPSTVQGLLDALDDDPAGVEVAEHAILDLAAVPPG